MSRIQIPFRSSSAGALLGCLCFRADESVKKEPEFLAKTKNPNYINVSVPLITVFRSARTDLHPPEGEIVSLREFTVVL